MWFKVLGSHSKSSMMNRCQHLGNVERQGTPKDSERMLRLILQCSKPRARGTALTGVHSGRIWPLRSVRTTATRGRRRCRTTRAICRPRFLRRKCRRESGSGFTSLMWVFSARLLAADKIYHLGRTGKRLNGIASSTCRFAAQHLIASTALA